MSLKDTNKNILVNGINHSVFYDKDSGAVEVRTEVQTGQGPARGGDAIYNSKTGATYFCDSEKCKEVMPAMEEITVVSSGEKKSKKSKIPKFKKKKSKIPKFKKSE